MSTQSRSACSFSTFSLFSYLVSLWLKLLCVFSFHEIYLPCFWASFKQVLQWISKLSVIKDGWTDGQSGTDRFEYKKFVFYIHMYIYFKPLILFPNIYFQILRSQISQVLQGCADKSCIKFFLYYIHMKILKIYSKDKKSSLTVVFFSMMIKTGSGGLLFFV